MKYILLLLGTMLFVTTAQSQTIITYEDGSTYTLKSNEQAYVTHLKLFSASGNYNKSYFKFVEAKPNTKRDYVAQEPDPNDVDPNSGLQYCDTVPGYPLTFGGYIQCVERPEDSPGIGFGS